jgi:preprotein translocase subunit Sec63
MNQTANVTEQDPFRVLGLSNTATESEIRDRYLSLIKRYTPSTHPERFRDIHSAYAAACDPLVMADRLINTSTKKQEWHEVIAAQSENTPNLPATLLLALGNRPSASE